MSQTIQLTSPRANVATPNVVNVSRGNELRGQGQRLGQAPIPPNLEQQEMEDFANPFANPAELENNNNLLNPLGVQDLQPQNDLGRNQRRILRINSEYPYIQLRDFFGTYMDGNQEKFIAKTPDEFIADIKEAIKDDLVAFYEKDQLNLFDAAKKPKIEMQVSFNVRPPQEEDEEEEILGRNFKTFPLSAQEGTLITWQPGLTAEEAEITLPENFAEELMRREMSKGAVLTEEERRKVLEELEREALQEGRNQEEIDKWIDAIGRKIGGMMEDYRNKVRKDGTGDKEKKYESWEIEGFVKETVISFLFYGPNAPNEELHQWAQQEQQRRNLSNEQNEPASPGRRTPLQVVSPPREEPNASLYNLIDRWEEKHSQYRELWSENKRKPPTTAMQDLKTQVLEIEQQLAEKGLQFTSRWKKPENFVENTRTGLIGLLNRTIFGYEGIGCSDSSKEISTRGSYVLWSTNTKKNRCAIYCVMKKLEVGAPVIDDKGSTHVKKRKDDIIKDFLRVQYERDGVQPEFPLAIKEFGRLASYFECYIELYSWNEETELMDPLKDSQGVHFCFGDSEKKSPLVKLMIENGHSFLIVKDKLESISKQVCPHCRTIYSKVHNQCDQTKIAYLNRRVEKNKKKISASDKFVTSINNRRCIFFDCETFTNEKGEHIPYAVGWGYPDEDSRGIKRKKEEDRIVPIKWEFKYEWGEGCMQRFIFWLEDYVEATENSGKKTRKPKKILIGFNNANYDNLLLAKTCLRLGMHFDFQIQNNALIGMQTELFKTWDLCRFLPGQSLAVACKNFGASEADQKSCFPHKFIRSWEDLEYVGVEPGPEYHWKTPENWTYITTPTWNLKDVCLKYLEKDIRGTIFVFQKLQETCFEALHVDIKEFITASHMSFDVWTNLVSDAPKETNRINPLSERKQIFDLYFPTLEQEDIFRQAIYGGRTYNTARDYQSDQYQRILDGEDISYEGVTDWMDVFDVVSLYASAMLFNQYPCGISSNCTEEDLAHVSSLISEEKYDDLPMGIYKVKYQPNKKLIIPALPRKIFRREPSGSIISEGLIWDLTDSEGYYTIIDIVEARKQGYEFEFISGVQWESKGPIFEKYIELALELKCKGEKEGNKTLRALGKLLCNALYGKMLQRPITETTMLIKDGSDLNKFLSTNNLVDIIFLNDEYDRLMVVGEECQREMKIRKPSFIGAFVLSYSRKIMHNFAGMADPWRGTNEIAKSLENSFMYTDTDSLFYKSTPHILEALKNVLKENNPGSLWYDLEGKPTPKVIRAVFLGPKTYLLIYYTKDKKIQVKMRSKGIPSSFLTKEDYFNLLNFSQVEKKEVPQVRKVMHSKKEQIPFTLIATNVQKCLMNDLWKGRYFVNNQESYPFGHEQIPFLQSFDREELFTEEDF
jgi:hypothetical protein